MCAAEEEYTCTNRDECMDLIDHHWEYLRYYGRVSLSFENIFIVFLAGAITILSNPAILNGIPKPDILKAAIFVFLILFNISVIIFEIKAQIEFYNHAKSAIKIAEEIDIDNLMGKPLGMYSDKGHLGFKEMFDPRKIYLRYNSDDNMVTSPLLNPSLWILFIYIVSLGFILSWSMYQYISINIVLMSLLWALVILIAEMVSIYYIFKKTKKIDNHIQKNINIELK